MFARLRGLPAALPRPVAPLRSFAAAAAEARPFKVLGIQQIAVGGLNKGVSAIVVVSSG